MANLSFSAENIDKILNKANSAIQDDTNVINVANGGTGINAAPKNSILVGDGGTQLKPVSPPDDSEGGVFYYDKEKNTIACGVLPVKCGGTGATDLSNLETNFIATLDTGGTGYSKTDQMTVAQLLAAPASFDDQTKKLAQIPNGNNGYILVSKGVNVLPGFEPPEEVIPGTWEDSSGGKVLKVENGGTGTTSLSGLRYGLGLGNDITQPVPVDKGGTGVTDLDDLSNDLGLGQSIRDAIPMTRGGTGSRDLLSGRLNGLILLGPGQLTSLGPASGVFYYADGTTPRLGNLPTEYGGTGGDISNPEAFSEGITAAEGYSEVTIQAYALVNRFCFLPEITVTNNTASDTTIATGLPQATFNTTCILASEEGKAIPCTIDTEGKLVSTKLLEAGVPYKGSATYLYTPPAEPEEEY